MRKTIVIALRDYLAAVKTKSFLISLALMPVLVVAGMLVGRLSENVVDTTEKKIAIIDHTALAQAEASTRPAVGDGAGSPVLEAAGLADRRPLYQILNEAAQKRNAEMQNKETGEFRRAPYVIDPVELEDFSDEDLERKRLELSDSVRAGDLFAFVEIGPMIISTAPQDLMKLSEAGQEASEAAAEMNIDSDSATAALTATLPREIADLQDLYGIRYSSKSATNPEVQAWIGAVLTPAIQSRRLQGINVPADKVMQLVQPLQINQRALAVRETDGTIGYESAPNPMVGMLVPFFSVFLLFSLIATAAFPLTTNVIEEKQLRIAEVLLGSVRPFELMLGKLLGGVAISLTLATIYGVGLFVVVIQFGILDFIGLETLVWFAIFASLATLMYGALSVAAGAAVTNLKEAQNIQTPIVLLPMAPAITAINIAQNPEGPLAQLMTWFPLTTPITSVMRITIRDGMPLGERFLAAGLSIVTTLALVWIAGRIFRHGMLHSEKAAGMKDMWRWVTRG